MTTHVQRITAEELLRMPDDGMRRELVRGELHEMAPSGHTHGRVVMKFSWPLGQYVEEHDLGAVYAAETGFLLATDPDTVRAPDVSFVRRDRLALASEAKGYFPGAPDLAVEVISPGDVYTEVEEKVGEWLEAGTRMVVVINPRNRTVKVYRSVTDVHVLTEHDTFDGGDVVAGFQLSVRRLFPH
jgi:Uma2 family endonuclease